MDNIRYNKIFNCDPVCNIVKTLQVDYIDNNNNINSVEFSENTEIKIPELKKIKSAKYGANNIYVDVTDNLCKFMNIPSLSQQKKNEKILLFTDCCIIRNKTIIIYGHSWKFKINTILLKNTRTNKNIKTKITHCGKRSDFFISIDFSLIDVMNNNFDIIVNDKIEFTNVELKFPFEKCNIPLVSDKSFIISTMCKNYNHRLDEWIRYNKKLGVSGIIIFNNDIEDLNDIEKKYKNFVTVINFPYTSLCGSHWNNIQRISLHIGVNAYIKKCRNIALIDADEFIFSHNYPNESIEKIMDKYKTSIVMKSNIITNKGDNDIIDNNILTLCKYKASGRYTKAILNTNDIKENEFIITPHNHDCCKPVDTKELHHYHAWANKRCKWGNNLPEINFLQEKILL